MRFCEDFLLLHLQVVWLSKTWLFIVHLYLYYVFVSNNEHSSSSVEAVQQAAASQQSPVFAENI